MGGHCIPVDPFYLSWIAEQHGVAAKFVELAGEINAQMPTYVVQRLEHALADRGQPLAGSRVLLLGIAYKKDVDDPRESPAFRILELLRERSVTVAYHDPHIPHLPPMRHYSLPPLASQPLTAELLQSHAATLIVTDHSAVDYRLVVEHSPLVVDTRNVTQEWRVGRTNVELA
jgi:UDP-N-acetyl-D-glucosamine dehydrogenase